MRIERMELDGFGHFANAHWDLAPGMTVMLGSNEAGKTTLLNAIRALLFGFESTREGRTWYPALSGGRRGGRLVVVTAQGERWTIERHGDRGGQGTLTVRAPSGNQGGIETLDRVLGRADRDLFNTIFAFGLGELESFATLSSEGVASRIYGAGSGLGGVSALDLERRLRGEQEAVYKPRGREQPLNRLLTRMEDLRTRIAELERQPAEHEAAVADLAQLRARREELRIARLTAAERSDRLRRLLDAQPKAAILAELGESLAGGDPRADALPPDALAALDRRLASVEHARGALVAANAEIGERERRLEELAVHEPLLESGSEIVALRDERQIQEQRRVQAADAERAAAGHALQLAEQLRRVGGWSEEQLLGVDDSIATVETTRDAERRLTTTTTAIERLEQRVASARSDLAADQRDMGVSGGPDEVDLQRRAQALQGVAELDRRLAALDERERLIAELGSSLGSGGWLPAIVAGVLVAISLALLGAVLNAAAVGVALGVLLGVVVVYVVHTHDPRRPAPAVADRATLVAEREQLLGQSGLPAGASVNAVAAATSEVSVDIASLRAAGVHRARLAERAEALVRLEVEATDARRDAEDAMRNWRAWLAERDLPPDASPEAARQLLAAVGIARRAAEQRDEELGRAAAIREAAAAFDARLDELLSRLGRAIPAGDARRTSVVALAEELERSAANHRRRAELVSEIRERHIQREALATNATQRDVELADYLRQCGAATPDELRSLAAVAAQRRELQQRVRETRAALIAIAGGDAALPALLAEATSQDPSALTAALEEAATEAKQVEEQEAQALTREGALSAFIDQLEAADELGAARQELALASAQAQQAARGWTVRAVTLALLAETRHRYERERQPQVVQDAEAYFATITDGRYPRIVAPPGEANVLVEPEHGSPLTTDQLSRGTAEQLYLALRFGLIEQFARASEPLPVVMDDILVNFDPQRAERAVRAIGQLATRYQVLFFTCHPRIAELLDPDGVATQRLA